jgi:hypothetical protein
MLCQVVPAGNPLIPSLLVAGGDSGLVADEKQEMLTGE